MPTEDVTQHQAQVAADLHQLIDAAWQRRLQDDPLFATHCGDHRYNDRLPAVSEADYQRQLSGLRDFARRLQSVDRTQLSDADQLNYDIFQHTLEDEIGQLAFRTYLLPMRKREGFHIFFPDLPNYAPLRTVEDYENYIARLNGFEEYVEGHIELMRAGIREGYVPARVAWDGAAGTMQAHVVNRPEESLLYAPFAAFPGTIAAAQQARLREAGARAILSAVAPGYTALLRFVQDEYLPAARSEIGISSLPNGDAYYEHCVRYATTLPISPHEVYETGMTEVERIREEMERVIGSTGFQGSFADFVAFLRADAQFYASTPEALLKEAAWIMKRVDGALPALFKKLPKTPCGLRPIPDFVAPNTTSAYYTEPVGDGSKPAIYYLNTYDLKSRPLYELEALTLHEALPGHHVHIALQQEMHDLPPFRRFGYLMAFGEGWALYAERLGLEMGFYQDAYSNFGRLSFEMWRATRLVVDTGMHYFGWTRQQAIDFMAVHTGLTMLNIVNEVDRYIDWPGQSLAYKIGELKIRQLRADTEKALGDSFDLRDFHDLILQNGSVPLAVLEKVVQNKIDVEKRLSD
jgi:uncharacterized protein (DUF885 family)